MKQWHEPDKLIYNFADYNLTESDKLLIIQSLNFEIPPKEGVQWGLKKLENGIFNKKAGKVYGFWQWEAGKAGFFSGTYKLNDCNFHYYSLFVTGLNKPTSH